jgi:hypothetical protein
MYNALVNAATWASLDTLSLLPARGYIAVARGALRSLGLMCVYV